MERQEAYDKIKSQYPGLEESTYQDFLDKKISPADFLNKGKPNLTSRETKAQDEGYDIDLIGKTIKEIEKDVKLDQQAKEFDLEGSLIDYKPSTKQLYNASGIRTDKDLSNSIRGKLSFGLQDKDSLIFNAKQLIIEDLKNQGYSDEDINEYGNKIVTRLQAGKFKDFKTNPELVFSIPKELGGDGKLYKANQPGFDMGDLTSISGDILPISGSIVGGTFGSAGGPAGTIGGSALTGGLLEYARLMIGRYGFGLNKHLSDEEFNKFAKDSAIEYGAFDAAATALFLPLAAIVKKTVLTTPKDKLSIDTIKKVIAEGGVMDKAIKEPRDKAIKMLVDAGLDEKQAQEYLAVNLKTAIPKAGIVEEKTESKIFRGLKATEDKELVNQVENKLLKNLTGLNKIDDKAADDLISNIDEQAKIIRNQELANANQSISDAFQNLQKTKQSVFKTGTDDLINDFNIDFAGVTGKLNETLGILSNQIDNITLTNKITLKPGNFETKGVIDNILKEYKRKPFKELNKKELAKLSPDQLKDYKSKSSIDSMFKMLEADTGAGQAVAKLEKLKKGIQGLETQNVSLKDLVLLRSLTRQIDEALPPGTQYQKAVRKFKGELDATIQGGLVGNLDAAAKVAKFDELLALKNSTYFKDFSQTFGYGTSKKVINPLQYKGGNIFNKFVEPSETSFGNSKALGILLKNDSGNFFNTSSKQRIKSVLYQKYFDDVGPSLKGEKGKMTHQQFLEKYGQNYKNILGKEYDEFFKNPNKAIEGYNKIIDEAAKVTNDLSKALPGIPINVLDSGAPGKVVDAIFTLGNKANIDTLVYNLGKNSPNMLRDIRKVYLDKMLNTTRIENAEFGKSYARLNGEALNKFLNENRGIIKQLFHEDFYKAHKTLADALEVIQTSGRYELGIPGVKLTDKANKAGLFVDIFAGPLNHKRLILNRIARIYDGFNITGDSMRVLSDYNLFIESAKKNFLAGNYPKVFDDILLNGKPSEKKFIERSIDKINKVITLGQVVPGFRRTYTKNVLKNPLFYKNYIQEKIQPGQDDIGEPQLYEPVDVALEGVKKGTLKLVDKTVLKLANNLFRAIEGRKSTTEEMGKKAFEKDILKKGDKEK